MNATYTDEITNIISDLRSTIYNSEDFVRHFSAYMNHIGYTSIGFGYDPAGGMNIYVSFPENISAEQCNNDILSAFENSIKDMNFSIDKSMINSLVNIIYAGNTTFMVKL